MSEINTPAATPTHETPQAENQAPESVNTPQAPEGNPPQPPQGDSQTPSTPDGTPTPPPGTPDEQAEAPVARVVPAADGYTLPDGIPPQFGQFAHQNDMTQAQLDNSLQVFGQVQQAQKDAELTAIENAGTELLKTWGDEATYNVNLAKRALAQNDPEGHLAEALKTSGYGNHPAVLNFLKKVGSSMKEGGFLKGNVNTPPGKKTLAQSMYGTTHPTNE